MSFKDMLGLAGKLPETARKLTELARDRSAEWAESQALTPEGVNEAFAEAFRCGRIGCACRGVFRAAVPMPEEPVGPMLAVTLEQIRSALYSAEPLEPVSETNRWWQAFCSPAPHAFLAVSGADDIVTGQANWADKAIAEARKRGRV